MPAYNVSDRLTIDIATDTLHKLKGSQLKLTEGVLIHPDQEVHYTSPVFQNLAKSYGLIRSMSRRGTPQESFFGHLKDEAYIKSCETRGQLKDEIDQYMTTTIITGISGN